MKLSISLAFFILLFLPQISHAINFRGYVRDENGQPIADVYVSPIARINSSKTDEKGYFNFEIGIKLEKEVVVFQKNADKNWYLKVEIFDEINDEVNVTLSAKYTGEIKEVPICQNKQNNKNRLIGKFLIISVPKSFKHKSGNYDHGIYDKIILKNGRENDVLTRDEGQYGMYPASWMILDSEKYEVIRTNGGLDWRGITKKGIYWRYFSSGIEAFVYATESKETAEIFNNFLDNLCFKSEK